MLEYKWFELKGVSNNLESGYIIGDRSDSTYTAVTVELRYLYVNKFKHPNIWSHKMLLLVLLAFWNSLFKATLSLSFHLNCEIFFMGITQKSSLLFFSTMKDRLSQSQHPWQRMLPRHFLLQLSQWITRNNEYWDTLIANTVLSMPFGLPD